MQSTHYKLSEFFILFIIIPIVFTLNSCPNWVKTVLGGLGFLYIIYVLLAIEKKKFRIAKGLNWKLFFKETFFKLLFIAIVTGLFVWFTAPEDLFTVALKKTKMWLAILFVYSLFSVYPQELIYRTFYFERYRMLFKNEALFIFINAIVFSLAHLFFRNTLVIIITFLGGILFALTYKKTESTLLVSIEHAIYGCWLFTVGMGDMLGFPS